MQQRFAILVSAASLVMTAACSQSDAGITTAVKAKMATDDAVKASEINVDTHNHVVTLNGTVGSQAEKERAVLIARDVNGVSSVVDDLIVGPVPAATGGYEQKTEDKANEAKENIEDTAHDAKVKTENAAHDAKVKAGDAADKAGEVLTDAAITSEVKTKFLAAPGVSGLNINVDTTDGVVTLTGMVKSQAEMNKAMTVARASKGVKRVVNHLKVG
jgi:hyperosmotically inducible periplasmic protein